MLQIKSAIGIGGAFLASLPLGAQSRQEAKQSSPNIILILMDDMGYGDIGRNGANQYDTPNLNRLAAQGMQFTWCSVYRCTDK